MPQPRHTPTMSLRHRRQRVPGGGPRRPRLNCAPQNWHDFKPPGFVDASAEPPARPPTHPGRDFRPPPVSNIHTASRRCISPLPVAESTITRRRLAVVAAHAQSPKVGEVIGSTPRLRDDMRGHHAALGAALAAHGVAAQQSRAGRLPGAAVASRPEAGPRGTHNRVERAATARGRQTAADSARTRRPLRQGSLPQPPPPRPIRWRAPPVVRSSWGTMRRCRPASRNASQEWGS